ncbi:ubiquitin carboxyl-terminal hydrolase [Endozoicomonas lisbonensis]
MIQPFNPDAFTRSGIAKSQLAGNILRFSENNQIGTEDRGVFWQSKGAKKFGRAVKLFIDRRQQLNAKLKLQTNQGQQVVVDTGLKQRSIKVISPEECKNLVNLNKSDPVSAIHQAEIGLLEMVVRNNHAGVNEAMDNLKSVFQQQYPNDWQEKYPAFLKNEAKEILQLSQKHSGRSFLARIFLGKLKYKKVMEVLNKKIDKQQGELKKLETDRIIQGVQAKARTPRRPEARSQNWRATKPLRNRGAAPVADNNTSQIPRQNTPEPVVRTQQAVSPSLANTPEARTPEGRVPVAEESPEIKRQLAFEIIRDRSEEIKAEDYQLAEEYDLLNSDMVEALLKEGDVSHAVQTFTELARALRPEKQVSDKPSFAEPAQPTDTPDSQNRAGQQRQALSAGDQRLMARLMREKDFSGKPLVQSEGEFRQLFAGLPDGSVSDDQAISALRHFRKLQQYQDMISVRFTPDMYPILLRSNALEDDAMELNPAGLDADIYAQLNTPENRTQMRKEALLNAFKTVGKYKDVVPERTAIDQIHEAGMKPLASGLYNWGNNCFMNASLQMIAIHMAAPELSDVVLDYQPAGLTEEQTMLYLQLQQSFLNVCDAINDRDSQPVALVSLQRQFMQDYLKYSQATGRQAASFILADQQPDSLRPALIPQQDPHEFLNDLADIFGLSHHPKCSVHLYDHKKMMYQGKERLRKTMDEGGHAFLPISVNRQSPKTISRCVSAHLSPEKLDEFNRFKWDRADKARVGLADGDQVDTLKQQAFVSSGQRPPDRLMLQMKIFGFENGAASKLNDEAATLMAHSDRRVRIPIASNPDGEPNNKEYDITGIVCHRGSSSTSGHYVSLRFEGDKVIVCDDDVVLELNEYARFRGRPLYKNWQDFCAKEKLTGYLFSLQKVKSRAMAMGG